VNELCSAGLLVGVLSSLLCDLVCFALPFFLCGALLYRRDQFVNDFLRTVIAHASWLFTFSDLCHAVAALAFDYHFSSSGQYRFALPTFSF
jgi:hypothetical protein